MRNNVIEATIFTGPAAGGIALIPRIPMIPTDLPFPFKRLQFPIKVSFAITINKVQGQTHFLTWTVGLSRTGIQKNSLFYCHMVYKQNVVYSEILWEQYCKIKKIYV